MSEILGLPPFGPPSVVWVGQGGLGVLVGACGPGGPVGQVSLVGLVGPAVGPGMWGASVMSLDRRLASRGGARI